MSRGHRFGHHEPMEETLSFLAMAASVGASVALYEAENASLVIVSSTDPAAPTPVAAVAGVAVSAGQTVSITGSIDFTGSGAGSRPVLTLSIDGTEVDRVTDLAIAGGETPEREMTTRTITLSGIAPGAHTISLGASSPDGAGGVVISGPGGGLAAAGQLTVLVV